VAEVGNGKELGPSSGSGSGRDLPSARGQRGEEWGDRVLKFGIT
jgi:hypothetical protein